jgi:phage terminase small subunit
MANGRGSTVKELAPRVLELLPGTQSAIAKALGRKPSDGTVRRTLEHLASQGFAKRKQRRWERCQTQPQQEIAYPEDFDQEAKGLYTRVIAYLRALPEGLWDDNMVPTAQCYVRSKQLARQARVAIGDRPYTMNSAGRAFKHPAVEDARQHERDAHTYAEALLLTPKARQVAGVKGGGGADPFDF